MFVCVDDHRGADFGHREDARAYGSLLRAYEGVGEESEREFASGVHGGGMFHLLPLSLHLMLTVVHRMSST